MHEGALTTDERKGMWTAIQRPSSIVALSLLHLVAGLALACLLAPLVFCILVSVADSTSLETPFATGRVSLRWYGEFLGDPRWLVGLSNSLQIALLTVTISVVCGTSAAMAFERCRFRGRAVIGAAILTPLFVPPVVLGIQSLTFHQRIGLWGTLVSIAVAHSLWAIPLVFTVTRASLAGVDPWLEAAARGLGASPVRAFALITMPLILPGILASAFFAFIISLNEFIMALFLATPRTQTLPTLIWPQVRTNVTPVVAAASGVTILITVSVLLLVNRLVDLRKMVQS